MYITQFYIEQRAVEIMQDKSLAPLIGMVIQVPVEEVSFYITHENSQVKSELINYLKGN